MVLRVKKDQSFLTGLIVCPWRSVCGGVTHGLDFFGGHKELDLAVGPEEFGVAAGPAVDQRVDYVSAVLNSPTFLWLIWS